MKKEIIDEIKIPYGKEKDQIVRVLVSRYGKIDPLTALVIILKEANRRNQKLTGVVVVLTILLVILTAIQLFLLIQSC